MKRNKGQNLEENPGGKKIIITKAEVYSPVTDPKRTRLISDKNKGAATLGSSIVNSNKTDKINQRVTILPP